MEAHLLLEGAAELPAGTLTDVVVSAAHDAAGRTIEDAEILRISAADQQRVAEALRDPPAPEPALVRAFQRRQDLFGVD